MRRIHLIICLIGLMVNVTSADEESPEKSQEDEIIESRDRIFSMGSPNMEPNEVFEALQKLRAAYAKANLIDDWTDKVDKFLGVRQVSKDKCTTEHFKQLAELAALASDLSFNLADYLEEARLNQFELCRLDKAQQMQKAAIKVPATVVFNINSLKRAIRLATPGGGESLLEGKIDQRALYQGVINFIRFENNQQIDECELASKSGVDYWRILFKKHIGYMCTEILNQMSWATEFYLTLLDSIPLMARIEASTHDWIENMNICRVVEQKEDNIVRGTFESVKPKPKRDSCFGLFC